VLPCPALAQDAGGERDAATLPPVVVTASRLPDARPLVSATATFLDRRAIDVRAPASVPQLLQGASGAYLDQAGGPGGFASLYLRGADPSATLVLIDGVRANDSTNSRGGAFDFGSLDPASVDRVEILPGASSAIYGADAMAGVINVVTRVPGAGEPGARARLGAGGSRYRTGLVEGRVGTGTLGVNLGASVLEDGPWASASQTRLETAWARGRLSSSADLVLDGAFRATRREGRSFPEDSGGPAFAVRRTLDERESDGAFASLSARKRLAWGTLSLYGTGSRTTESVDSPGVAPGVRDPFGIPPNRSDSTYRRYVVGAGAATGVDDPTGAAGVEYQRESGRSESELMIGPQWIPGAFSLERTTWSVFGEGRVRPTANSALQVGLRADAVTGFGLRPSVRVGALYAVPDTGASLRASFGTGFKAPSFFALGNPIVGNPNLLPEKSRTAELGVAVSDADAPLAYAATVFRSTYGNLVDFDAGPPPQLVNRTEVGVAGIELSARYRAKAFSLGGSATLLEYDLPAGVDALRSRPRQQARAFASAAVTAALSFDATFTWIGKVYDSSVPTGPRYLPAASILDLALTVRAPHVTFRVAVDNALDRDYEQFIGFPALGRRFRADVEVKI